MKKKLVSIFVILACIVLLLFSVYMSMRYLDLFINPKHSIGRFNIISKDNGSFTVRITYYNNYKMKEFSEVKEFNNSYLNDFDKLDSMQTPVIYTKWFNQVYVKGIKNPRWLILLYELVVILLAIAGIAGSGKELWGRGK